MLAHLPLAERLALAETFGELVAQRRAAEEHAGRVQIQADEWERAARGSAEEAVAWRSKAQVWSDLAVAVANELEEAFRDPDTSLDTVADAVVVRLRAGRLLVSGESLPSHGQLVNVVPMETVKVGGKL